MTSDLEISRRNLMGVFGLAAAAALAGCSTEIEGQALPGRPDVPETEPTALNHDVRLGPDFYKNFPEIGAAINMAAKKIVQLPERTAAVLLATWAEAETRLGRADLSRSDSGSVGLYQFNLERIEAGFFKDLGIFTQDDALNIQTSCTAAAILYSNNVGCPPGSRPLIDPYDLESTQRASRSYSPDPYVNAYPRLVRENLLVGRLELKASEVALGCER